MTKATPPGPERASGAKMTLRVYRVNGEGAVTEDGGTLCVMPCEWPLPTTAAFPPCKCVRCRGRRAAR